jgi:hypothetical protein
MKILLAVLELLYMSRGLTDVAKPIGAFFSPQLFVGNAPKIIINHISLMETRTEKFVPI